MKQYVYIDLNFTDAEKQRFSEKLDVWCSAPKKWLCCNRDVVLVECGTNVVEMPWSDAEAIISMQTVREIKRWGNNVSEIVAEGLKK